MSDMRPDLVGMWMEMSNGKGVTTHRFVAKAWTTSDGVTLVKFNETTWCEHCGCCISEHTLEKPLQWWNHARAGWVRGRQEGR